MAKYRCPVCKVEAEIDKENKQRSVKLGSDFRFPKHGDCELVKGVMEIDLSKLEPVS